MGGVHHVLGRTSELLQPVSFRADSVENAATLGHGMLAPGLAVALQQGLLAGLKE
jgi:hypothetical protein